MIQMESKQLNENSIMSVEQSVLEESSEMVMFQDNEYLSLKDKEIESISPYTVFTTKSV